MNRAMGRVTLGVVLAVSVLSVVMLALQSWRIGPIEGATLVTEAAICADDACLTQTPITLPYRSAYAPESELKTIRLIAHFETGDPMDDLQAFYIPRLSDHVTLTLNGVLLRKDPSDRRVGLTPIFQQVPKPLLLKDTNTVTLDVTGRLTEGIELYPFYVGVEAQLRPSYVTRFALGTAFARFGIVIMSALAFICLAVWAQRRVDRRYLVLGLSCICAVIILLGFGFGTLWGGYKTWLGTLHMAMASYALLIVTFLRSHLSLPTLWVERSFILGLAVIVVSLVFVPADYLHFWVIGVDVFTALGALWALTIFWIHRDRCTPSEFTVMFSSMLLATAFGAHDMVLEHTDLVAGSFYTFHYVPICVAPVCLWLLWSELNKAVRRYEVLNTSLNAAVAEKTAALEESFAQLAASERREAVDAERHRIMLDLHDGIGGQLVSTLAYMKNKGHSDPRVKSALSAALDDLALVLDSLDSHESLTTLLGMLRTRIEPLLGEHDLVFDWQIMDDPEVPNASPSSNLHVARIVQEAITNVIKHAKASTITVFANKDRIVIADDGIGFQCELEKTLQGPGHGLKGMQHRAGEIGAKLTLDTSDKGTRVELDLSEGRAPLDQEIGKRSILSDIAQGKSGL